MTTPEHPLNNLALAIYIKLDIIYLLIIYK
jgi:hypothetical protein